MWRLVSRKGFQLGHVLLLNTNRKSHMSSTAPSHLTLSDFERSMSRSLRFWKPRSRNGPKIGHMLLLKRNGKSFTGSPLMWLHLTLVTLKGQCQGHIFGHRSRSQILKASGSRVRPCVTIKTPLNRKSHTGSPMTLSHLTLSDLVRWKSRSLRLRNLICRKRAQKGYMVLVDLNRTPYIRSNTCVIPWYGQDKVW